MDYIPSPYNFVPLSPDVYFPDWADYVSQDVPFSDGISGEIEIEVTAKTPIYVRNGGNWQEDESKNKNPDYQEFFRMTPGGKYMIPGTSFKGMLRNIIEIISHGKMKVADKRYGIRDLNLPAYTKEFTEAVPGGYRCKAKAGWLNIQDDNQWTITPCEYVRVEQEDLEKYQNISIGTISEEAKEKYERWYKRCNDLRIMFDIEKHIKGLICSKAINLGSGKQEGTLVFTGQPTARRKGKTGIKHLEFIFYQPKSNAPINVNDQIRKDFEFIHSDGKGNPNETWKYWENSNKIPVFYIVNNNVLHSIGLAMMYRFPCNSIHRIVKNTSPKNFDSKPDLAELMFGYVNDKSNEALRGRVHVGHLALQNDNPKTMEPVTTVLGSPKPTYYPNYLDQKIDKNTGKIIGNNYKTLMDSDAEIRGWKRYIVRKDEDSPNPPSPATDSIATTFKPLPSGSKFTGKIRVHNLRPQELGALIWTLTWGGNSNYRHLLGMAKPYGYGSVQVTIRCSSLHDIKDTTCQPETLRQNFEEFMKAKIKGWAIPKALLAMSDPKYQHQMELRYPQLKPDNEFVKFKRKDYRMVLYPLEVPEKTTPSYSKPISRTSFSGYKNGDKVSCVVLEEKTKKGGWRFQIENEPENRGILHPTSKIPPDIEPGKIYEMIIFSYSKDNSQFKWLS